MNRDWRVDTLRGYFLVCMTLAHFPNPVVRFTEYSLGYASAPDGFVFLSGLVSAWVYLRVAEKRGEPAMKSKVWRRTRDIYLCHLALMTLGILFALQSGALSYRASHPIRSFVMGALLLNQGGFDKILPMYCVFLALAPLVFKQFKSGRAWLVGLISAGLWLASQFGLGDNTPRLPWMNLGTFNLCAWQAYFVTGLYLGYRRLRSKGTPAVCSRFALSACIVVASALFLDRHLFWIAGHHPVLGHPASPDHNPIRFIDAACLGYILWAVPRAIDLKLMKLRLFQFLNQLGQHSLQVFVFSMLLTRLEAHLIRAFPLPAKLALTFLTVASLILPAWLHQFYRESKLQQAPVTTLRLNSQPLA